MTIKAYGRLASSWSSGIPQCVAVTGWVVVAGPAVHVCLGPACPDPPGYELQIMPPSGGCDWTVISDNSDTGAGERPRDSAAACCNHKISTSRIDIQISVDIQIPRYPELIIIYSNNLFLSSNILTSH